MNRFIRWCTAYPSRTFLLGMLFGISMMWVRTYHLLSLPVIVAEPVDNVFERYTRKQTFFLHDCPKKGKTLQIQIRTQDEVRAFGRTMGYDVPGLLGYTDSEGNRIVCVNSIEVLIHEIRHIFEGGYHRNMPSGDRIK
jgi:hypothetical protein